MITIVYNENRYKSIIFGKDEVRIECEDDYLNLYNI